MIRLTSAHVPARREWYRCSASGWGGGVVVEVVVEVVIVDTTGVFVTRDVAGGEILR